MKKEGDGVRWFLRRSGLLGEEVVFLSRRLLGGRLIVSLRDARSGERLLVQEVPPLDGLPALPEDRRPPTICTVSVREVARRVLLEAVIRWETDKPTEGEVHYGPTPRYGQRVCDVRLSTRHEVILSDLREATRYHLCVVARDLWGNVVRTGDLTFCTAPSPGGGRRGAPSPPPGGARAEVSLYRLGRRPVVLIRTDAPVDLRLGGQPRSAGRGPQAPAPPRGHPPLKDWLTAGLRACYSCHPPESLGVSHPVGVRPSPRIRASRDVPLPEGRVACTSCHLPHVARRPYLLRKEQQALCLSCHSSRYAR